MKFGWRSVAGLFFFAALPLWADVQPPAMQTSSATFSAAASTGPASLEATLALPATAWVIVPVADVRSVPRSVDDTAALRRPYAEDSQQETQLIYNEKVLLLERRGNWFRVSSVEQPEFSHDDVWEGYPGWVAKENLSLDGSDMESNAIVRSLYAKLQNSTGKGSPAMDIPLGAKLHVINHDASWARVQRHGQGDGWIRMKDLVLFDKIPKDAASLRKSILKTAREFIGQPYYWGGRCPHRDDDVDHPTGVDCSSLANLAYRLNGVDIPRDAHEQYLKSKPLQQGELKPGDLIFLAKPEKPNKVVHVMLYAGGEKVIEAVEQFDTVRQVTLKQKLGVELSDIWPGERTGENGRAVVLDRYVYFGRFLPD